MSQQTGQYFVRMGTQILGPLTLDQLINLRDRGRLQPFHSVSSDGKTWQPANALPQLFPPPQESQIAKDASSPAAAASAAEVQWYYVDSRAQQQGPIGEAQLLQLFQDGAISSDTMVWKAGMDQWQPLSSVLPPTQRQAGGSRLLAQLRARGARPFIITLAISLIVELVLSLGGVLVFALAFDQLIQLWNWGPGKIPGWLTPALLVLGIGMVLCWLLQAVMIFLVANSARANVSFPMGAAAAAVMLVGAVLSVPLLFVVASGILNVTIGVLFVIFLLAVATGWFLALLFLRLLASPVPLAKEFGYQTLMYALSTVVVMVGLLFSILGILSQVVAVVGLVLFIVGGLAWFAVVIWTVVDLFRLSSWMAQR